MCTVKQLSSIDYKRVLTCIILLLVGMLTSAVTQAQTIELPSGDISFRVLDGRKALSLAIRSKEKLQVSYFQLQSPPRIVVDIAKEISGLPGSVSVAVTSIEQVRIGRHPGKTRFVFDLKPGAIPYPGTDEAVSNTRRQFKIAFQKQVPVVVAARKDRSQRRSRRQKQTIKQESVKRIPDKPAVQVESKEEVAPALEVPKSATIKTSKDQSKKKRSGVDTSKVVLPNPVLEVEKKIKEVRQPSVVVHTGVVIDDELPTKISEPQLQIDRKNVRSAPRPVAEQTRAPAMAIAAAMQVDQQMTRLAPELVPGIKLELPPKEEVNPADSAALAIKPEQLGTEVSHENPIEDKGVAESLVDQMDEDPEVEPFNAPQAVQALFTDEGPIFDAIDYALMCGMGSLLVLLLLYRRRMQPSPMLRMSEVHQQEEEKLDVDSYSILGCTRDDSDQEIKTRYKQLLKIYHRDGLEAQDIPEELRKLSDDKLRKVQQAYERVRMERGF
jgi:hypothetical protein